MALDDEVVRLKREIAYTKAFWFRIVESGWIRQDELERETERLLALARRWCPICADQPRKVHAHGTL